MREIHTGSEFKRKRNPGQWMMSRPPYAAAIPSDRKGARSCPKAGEKERPENHHSGADAHEVPPSPVGSKRKH